MPTIRQSVQVAQKLPAISASGYEPIVIVGDYVTVAGVAATDVIEMGILPAGYVPVDAILAADDCDSNATPTITLDLGLMSGVAGVVDTARTGGSEAFAASTVAQAGGVARMALAAFTQVAPMGADRGIGVRLAAGAATLVVGAKLRLTVIARPALNGV